MTKRNYYTKEFKREAVRLIESGEKSAAQAASGTVLFDMTCLCECF